MATLDRDQYFLFLQTRHIERYWDMVRSAIEQIFQNSDVARQVDDFRREVSQSPEEEQILFYHAEPLDVAADLVGSTSPTAEQYRRYGELARRLSWVPFGSTGIT